MYSIVRLPAHQSPCVRTTLLYSLTLGYPSAGPIHSKADEPTWGIGWIDDPAKKGHKEDQENKGLTMAPKLATVVKDALKDGLPPEHSKAQIASRATNAKRSVSFTARFENRE
jgi:hypothetical protein